MEEHDLDLDDFEDFDADDAAELERSLAALERRGGVEAAFRAAVREELGAEAW